MSTTVLFEDETVGSALSDPWRWWRRRQVSWPPLISMNIVRREWRNN